MKLSKKEKRMNTAKNFLDIEAQESESEGESDEEGGETFYKRERAKIDESSRKFNFSGGIV